MRSASLLASQAWLSSRQAVVGTKCNKLLLLGIDAPGSPKLPPLQEVALPQLATGVGRNRAQPNAVQNALWSVGMLLRSAQSGGNSTGVPLPCLVTRPKII